jgi:hypothetical protein
MGMDKFGQQVVIPLEQPLHQKKGTNSLNFYKMTMDIMSLSGGMKKAILLPLMMAEALPTVMTVLWSFKM